MIVVPDAGPLIYLAGAGRLDLLRDLYDRVVVPRVVHDEDAGEAAAIPLAERLHAILLCDDGDARAIARQRGLQVVGTLGVLVLAKRRGRLPALGPVIAHMSALGMYVAPALVEQVLREVGER